MKNCLEQIKDYVDNHKEEMITLWQELVNLESYSREYEKVNQVAEWLKNKFEKEGLECELIDSEGNGKTLVGMIGNERKGKEVILCGHTDTVFPSGAFGSRPFRIEGEKAFGPGVLDMKGGIMIALYVIKALNHIKYTERPIKIIFSGDEEIGHTHSKGAEIVSREAKGGLCAFNLETGLPDNFLCVGRKGNIDCHITVTGLGAHVGNDFLSGKNAIEEMSYKIIELQKLTDLENGIIVSVDIIEGGTVSNAIPSQCKIEIDARFEKNHQMEFIKAAILNIASQTTIEGTKTKVEFVNTMPPFETTDEIMGLYEFVNEVAKENNFETMGHRVLGGNSDASYISLSGTPVICSFGVLGQWNHTPKEYALINTLYERTKLISVIITNLSRYENQEKSNEHTSC